MRRFASIGIMMLLAVPVSLGACSERSATGASPEQPVTAAPAAETSILDRVAVVGASASDGFGSFVELKHVKLADVLKASIEGETAVTSCSDFRFFMDPLKNGPKLTECALASDPTLVVAIDFLFWHAYGDIGPDGFRIRTPERRLEMLEKGLGLLDRFEGNIVVGDLPDMSAAIGLMLSRSQVPDSETLKKLNARIGAWAAERERASVVQMAAFVEEIQAGKAVRIGSVTWSEEEAGEMLLPDKLHPSAFGLVATAVLVADHLVETDGVPAGRFQMDPKQIMERLGGGE